MTKGERRLLKTYYRDASKVMRSIPGISYSHDGLVFLSKSVYTMPRSARDSPVAFIYDRVKQ